MTQQEKLIVSAYTGVLMCDFSDLHAFIEEKMGRSVFTHEMGGRNFNEKLRELCKDDFLSLCEDK